MDPELIAQLKRVLSSMEQILPKPVDEIDWDKTYSANWRAHSIGGYLEPLPNIEDIRLNDLLGIDKQKQIVEENTRQFLKEFPANNILMWGTRGTGKSSLVRALLNSYAPKGLRIVQVDKDDLVHLPDIFSQIKHQPYKFVIFCDDLSFETGETSYKVLKSALDGSVYSAPPNVLIYITSNRRHLLPEYKTDNQGAMMVNNEIHHGEGVEEKISLSDRFGLWVAFTAFSQEKYLKVVEQCLKTLCREKDIQVAWSIDIERAAIKWSHEKSKRCGRTAFQFSKHWLGQHLLKKAETPTF